MSNDTRFAAAYITATPSTLARRGVSEAMLYKRRRSSSATLAPHIRSVGQIMPWTNPSHHSPTPATQVEAGAALDDGDYSAACMTMQGTNPQPGLGSTASHNDGLVPSRGHSRRKTNPLIDCHMAAGPDCLAEADSNSSAGGLRSTLSTQRGCPQNRTDGQ